MPIYAPDGAEVSSPSPNYYTKAEIDALLAALGSGISVAILEDNKAQNTNGQTINAGSDVRRTLNTEVSDPDGIVSVSGDIFTLGAGVYLILWSATCWGVGNHQTMLYNETGGAVLKRGRSASNTAGGGLPDISDGSALVAPASSNNYSIKHRVANNGTIGGGIAANLGTEVYLRVTIIKYG